MLVLHSIGRCLKFHKPLHHHNISLTKLFSLSTSQWSKRQNNFLSQQARGMSSEKMPDEPKTKRARTEPEEGPQKNKEGEIFFDLGKNKRVTVRDFKGMTLVDIREYYEAGGEMRPGKKGISLNADQWEKMSGMTDKISKAVADMSK